MQGLHAAFEEKQIMLKSRVTKVKVSFIQAPISLVEKISIKRCTLVVEIRVEGQ